MLFLTPDENYLSKIWSSKNVCRLSMNKILHVSLQSQNLPTKISYDTHMIISGFKRLLSKLIFSFSCSLIRDMIAYGDGKSYIKAYNQRIY